MLFSKAYNQNDQISYVDIFHLNNIWSIIVVHDLHHNIVVYVTKYKN